MLANIDGSGGSTVVQANTQLLVLNHLRAVKAVATAAAASTPTANVIYQANTYYNVCFISNTGPLYSFMIPQATAFGTAPTASSDYNVGFPANGFAVGTQLLSNSTATLTTGSVLNRALNWTGTINTVSGNITGGFIFTEAAGVNSIANGMMVFCNTAGSPDGINNFQNCFCFVKNTGSGNTTFQLVYANGSPLSTTGSGLALTNIGIYYNQLTWSGSAGVVQGYVIPFPGLSPPSFIVSTSSGTPVAGTGALYWPGPFISSTVSGTAPLYTQSTNFLNTSLADGYQYVPMFIGNNSAFGLKATTIGGVFDTGGTPHNLAIGQLVSVVNSVATGVITTHASGTSYYVKDITNATSFTLATVNATGTAVVTTVGNASNGTIFIAFPGPISMNRMGGNNMINTLANTEGGGWLTDIHNTVSDYMTPLLVGSLSPTPLSFSTSQPILDLYNTATNKSSYPFQKITVIGMPAVTWNSTLANTFLMFHGAAAGRGYANQTPGTTLSFNGGGATVGGTQPTGPSAMVNQKANYANNGWQLNDFYYTVGCNSQYMHIIANTFVMSAGLRNNQNWENNYPDNPYVYNFSVDTRTFNTSVLLPSSLFAWMRTISNTATFVGPANYRNTVTSTTNLAQLNPVTGQEMNQVVVGTGAALDVGAMRYTTPQSGIFQLNSHSSNTSWFFIGYAPVYDANSGLFIPCAHPITIASNKPGSYNAGGTVKGLYKSLSGANNGTSGMIMTNFYTANATYIVDNEPYYFILNGPFNSDSFLIRRV